ncbi:PA14 domain-containing protein [Spirosoma sp. RP8]|uniref:PA14 domain-containing protein n=1 Tax=Spirosoma liriopis TaxID=2937440 RepID=A0ABT0HSR7_9BACT|nr:PA14 domain-containing protein [Spirosoma liriopis]MCK8495227.1 PA14 domain-containing protein [Spirosoma liriopis]
MKPILLYGHILLCLLAQQAWAQSGLKGDYYIGTNFEQKAFSRIDPAISFNWDRRSPGKGLSRSYYSIRWRGKLLAPVTGEYVFFAKVNDGIRVWVGNKLVLDSWQLNSYKHYTGTIALKAGQYYDLRVDYFNAIEWGEIYLYWKPPPTPNSALNPFAESGEPIAAQYFFQKAPLVTVVPKLISTVITKRSAVMTTIPKPALTRKLKTAKTIPNHTVVHPKRLPTTDTLAAVFTPIRRGDAAPSPAISSGVTFILRTVQFEQSSYVLLAQASTELNNLVQSMKANPQWHIHVTGHTDNVGDPRLNLALSEHRAKVVAAYLTRRGIAEERITTEGFGSKQPLGDNTTEGERSKNRRVAITIR